MFNFTVDKIEKSFEQSLDSLQLSYVDLIQVHDVEFSASLDQIIHKVIPTLQKFKKSGRAKYIGITGYHLGVLKRIVQLCPPGSIDTVLSYGRCNLINQGTNFIFRSRAFMRKGSLGVTFFPVRISVRPQILGNYYFFFVNYN